MVLLDLPWWIRRLGLVVFGVEIVLGKLLAVDKNLPRTHLDRLAGKPNDAFDVTFVRIVRIPKNDDIAAVDVAPADGLDLVVNELVYQEPFAVVQLWQHRRPLDDH